MNADLRRRKLLNSFQMCIQTTVRYCDLTKCILAKLELLTESHVIVYKYNLGLKPRNRLYAHIHKQCLSYNTRLQNVAA